MGREGVTCSQMKVKCFVYLKDKIVNDNGAIEMSLGRLEPGTLQLYSMCLATRMLARISFNMGDRAGVRLEYEFFVVNVSIVIQNNNNE